MSRWSHRDCVWEDLAFLAVLAVVGYGSLFGLLWLFGGPR